MYVKSINTKYGKFIVNNEGYYYITTGFYAGKLLHRVVFEKECGEIPKGHFIHHIDGDKSNNEVSNLECVSGSEHIRKHKNSHKNPVRYSKDNVKQTIYGNVSGIKHVCKYHKKSYAQGFCWQYGYVNEAGVKKAVSAVTLNQLRNKVNSLGFKFEILDEDLAISNGLSLERTNSNLDDVVKTIDKKEVDLENMFTFNVTKTFSKSCLNLNLNSTKTFSEDTIACYF